MFKAKKTIMYIDVKGVDDMTDRRDLMREVIRRNCDVDSRIIDSLVDKLGSCGDKDHKKCEYQLRLENYDLGGIARDFELLKKAGIIAGWLPIGEATRNGEKITDIKQMDSKYGRISYYISPKLLYAQTGYVWEGK